MSNPFGPLNVLKEWKPGDTCDVSEGALKKARIDGRFDSYSQVYQIEGKRWKVQSQMSRASGDTVYTLVCVNE